MAIFHLLLLASVACAFDHAEPAATSTPGLTELTEETFAAAIHAELPVLVALCVRRLRRADEGRHTRG